MANQRENIINLRDDLTSQINDKRRIADLELMIQRLQHRLRIYEGTRTTVDDEEIVDENDPKKSDDSFNDNKGYLRREHHKYRLKEHVRGDDREYGKGD